MSKIYVCHDIAKMILEELEKDKSYEMIERIETFIIVYCSDCKWKRDCDTYKKIEKAYKQLRSLHFSEKRGDCDG